MSKKSGFSTLSVVLIVLFTTVVVLGGLFYLGLTEEDCCGGEDPKSSKEEIFDTTDWKIYRNDEYGFEFKYPADWIVVGDTDKEKTLSSNIITSIYLDLASGRRGVTGKVDLFLKGYSNIEEQVDFYKKIGTSSEVGEGFSFGITKGRAMEIKYITASEEKVDFIVFLEHEGVLLVIKFSQEDWNGFLTDYGKEQIVNFSKTFKVFDENKFNSKGQISPSGVFRKDSFKSSLDSRRVREVEQVRLALELYREINNTFPDNFEQLIGRYLSRAPEFNLFYLKCAKKKIHIGINLATKHPVLDSDADVSNVCVGDMINGSDSSGCLGKSGLKCYDYVMEADY